MQRCPRCGEENPDRFRLCGFCGTELVPQAPPAEIRKTVTIIFCDLKGSTNLGERLDPEALREVLGRYFEIMKAILERHGGTVEKYIGDAIMCVFGLPRLHEDDALRAVRAAAEMRSALADLNEELERRWGVRLANRTGVNTGEVVAGDVALGQRLVTGDTVNVTARLEQAAPESDVLIGDSTYRLVREVVDVEPVEPLTLKGKSEPVPAYRLIRVRSGEWFARRLEAPLVGRSAELEQLVGAFERAQRDRELEAVTVVGHAGMGKTRLVQEFLARTDPGTTVLRGRCLSYGEGMTFWPLGEIVRASVGAAGTESGASVQERLATLLGDMDVADRLGAAIGLAPGSFSTQETSWAVRRFVEILAERGPLVVVFEDIHWAEPTLLGLIEHVVDTAKGARAVVLCMARQDLFDEHPKWMEGRPRAGRIVLQPLTHDESAAIIENLSEQAQLPVAVRERLIANADGNPLYVEQMLSMLVDEGYLQRDETGRWVASGDEAKLEIPPTISALISARLDRLGQGERAVLDTGSVAGPVFYEDAVRDLSPAPQQPQVAVNLMVLTHKQLVRDEPSAVPAVRAFRFAHVLVRDAAYQRLLKRTRAQLHEAWAGWLERVTGSRAFEFDELIGYHLEQATRYLDELGPRDAKGEALALRAFAKLASSGEKASGRGDMPAAANLLERAIAVRPPNDPEAIRLAVDLAEALREMGEFERARAVVDKAVEAAASLGDERLSMSLRLVQLLVERSTAPAGWADVAQREAERAIAIFDRANDNVGSARAYRILGTIHGIACRYGAAQDAVQKAVDHARASGDTRQVTRSLPSLALCALQSPQPVADAIALGEWLVDETSVDRRAQAGVLYVLAPLYAMHGDFERARSQYRRARKTLEDLGDRRQVAFTALFSARVELLGGDAAAADAALRPIYELFHQAGERNFVPTAAAILAEAAHLAGRGDEALELARVSEELASKGDVESQYRWRCARARVLAARGETDAARDLANDALQIVLATDSPVFQAEVYAVLGEVLHRAGDAEDGEKALGRAAELYARKGDVTSLARLTSIRTSLSAVGRA
ncbi:MAG TPA: adenylate/guanylate cyclase domain-containing protein [Candidatus Limnocylindria bacterium]